MTGELTYDKLAKAIELLENEKITPSDYLSEEQLERIYNSRIIMKTEVEQNIQQIVERGVYKAIVNFNKE